MASLGSLLRKCTVFVAFTLAHSVGQSNPMPCTLDQQLRTELDQISADVRRYQREVANFNHHLSIARKVAFALGLTNYQMVVEYCLKSVPGCNVYSQSINNLRSTQQRHEVLVRRQMEASTLCGRCLGRKHEWDLQQASLAEFRSIRGGSTAWDFVIWGRDVMENARLQFKDSPFLAYLPTQEVMDMTSRMTWDARNNPSPICY